MADINLEAFKTLADTNFTALADLDLTQFDSGTGKWLNKTTKEVGVPDSLSDVDSSLVTGIKSGGIISINGGDNSKFDITAGTGFVIDNHTDPENPVIVEVTWTAFTAETVTNIATSEFSFIGINSSGTIQQQTVAFDTEDIRDFITIGTLLHQDNITISAIVQDQRPVFNRFLGAFDFEDSIGVITKSGNIYSANGVNLNLNKSAGETFRIGSNYSINFKSPNVTDNPSGTALTFNYEHQDGAGDFTVLGSTTVIDPDQYDDGSGTLASVPANDPFTIQRLFYFASLDLTRVMYSQNLYKTLADAEAALLGEIFNIDPVLSAVASFRGWLIVKRLTTDLTDTTNAKFITADKFGSGIGGGATSSTTTLQQSYDNSLPDPEILTNATQGALTLRRGSAADTDDVFEVQNNAGSQTFSVTGDGDVTANQLTTPLIIGGTGAGDDIKILSTPNATKGRIILGEGFINVDLIEIGGHIDSDIIFNDGAIRTIRPDFGFGGVFDFNITGQPNAGLTGSGGKLNLIGGAGGGSSPSVGGDADLNPGFGFTSGVVNICNTRGDLNLSRSGGKIGVFGASAVGQSSAYTRNATIVESRTLLASASATTLNNNNVLAAIIADLQGTGFFG